MDIGPEPNVFRTRGAVFGAVPALWKACTRSGRRSSQNRPGFARYDEPTAEKSVLVFLQKRPFLGAQIVQIPFLHYLREEFTGWKIVGVSPRSGSERYLQELGYLDEVLSYDNSSRNILYCKGVVRRLRRFRTGMAFQLRRSSFKGMALACFCNAARKVGFKGLMSRLYLDRQVVYDRNRYGAEVYLDLLGDDGIRLSDFAQAEKRQPKNYVLFITAGTRGYKLYPLERYIEAARLLRQRLPVHFLPAKEMKDVCAGLAEGQNRFVVHRDKSTKQVRALVLGARLVITNDCGPSHFAHIYDVPRQTLFADYAYRPDGKDVTREYFWQTDRARLIVSSDGRIGSIDPRHIAETALELLLQTDHGFPMPVGS